MSLLILQCTGTYNMYKYICMYMVRWLRKLSGLDFNFLLSWERVMVFGRITGSHHMNFDCRSHRMRRVSCCSNGDGRIRVTLPWRRRERKWTEAALSLWLTMPELTRVSRPTFQRWRHVEYERLRLKMADKSREPWFRETLPTKELLITSMFTKMHCIQHSTHACNFVILSSFSEFWKLYSLALWVGGAKNFSKRSQCAKMHPSMKGWKLGVLL